MRKSEVKRLLGRCDDNMKVNLQPHPHVNKIVTNTFFVNSVIIKGNILSVQTKTEICKQCKLLPALNFSVKFMFDKKIF
jgi:hypothetical protein